MRNPVIRAALSRLSSSSQQELARLHYARQIRIGRFRSPEPDFEILKEWLSPGDAAIDVGANVGYYTLRLAQLAGADGRVVAFEPVPRTFALLAANVQRAELRNVTLINAAASSKSDTLRLQVPVDSLGAENYYQAHVSDGTAGIQVLSLTIDSLEIPVPVKLVKIDAEGHELHVLKGMTSVIERDQPILIVEKGGADVVEFMEKAGYGCTALPGSPNYWMLPRVRFGSERPTFLRRCRR